MLNRRRFLKLAGITALATAAPRIPLAFGGDEAEHGGLLHLTATEAVRHISEGSLSVETYARALLAQAELLSTPSCGRRGARSTTPWQRANPPSGTSMGRRSSSSPASTNSWVVSFTRG